MLHTYTRGRKLAAGRTSVYCGYRTKHGAQTDENNKNESCGKTQDEVVLKKIQNKKIHRCSAHDISTVKHAQSTADTDSDRLYIEEAEIMKKLKHKHILELHDVVTHDRIDNPEKKHSKAVYLVLERCQCTLADAIERQERYLENRKTTERMFRELVSGIQYMHSKQIAHRDIKPANILIADDMSIKIADFGISRQVHTATNSSTDENSNENTNNYNGHTHTALQGTMNYMAIEVLLGDKTSTVHADLWSLGCVYYEILHKTILFPGTGQIDQIGNITDTLGISAQEKTALAHLPYTHLLRTQPRNHSHALFHLSAHDQHILSTLLQYIPDKREEIYSVVG